LFRLSTLHPRRLLSMWGCYSTVPEKKENKKRKKEKEKINVSVVQGVALRCPANSLNQIPWLYFDFPGLTFLFFWLNADFLMKHKNKCLLQYFYIIPYIINILSVVTRSYSWKFLTFPHQIPSIFFAARLCRAPKSIWDIKCLCLSTRRLNHNPRKVFKLFVKIGIFTNFEAIFPEFPWLHYPTFFNDFFLIFLTCNIPGSFIACLNWLVGIKFLQ